jgi:sugar transferase (PEP-CTERM/EpsH1 system associated)
MAQYVPKKRGYRRFIMDFVDVDSEKFATYGEMSRGPMGWVNRREGELLADYEDQVARDADLNLFVSDAEAELFRRRSGLGIDVVRTIDNGIDTHFFDPAAFPRIDGAEPLIVFTGQMDYRPNIDAAERFARRTFPAIRAKHPAALFAIVGRDPPPSVRELAKLKNVIVTGTVPDVRPWMAAASVVVAPLEIARGVQNKVLEAMAMARPVVTTDAVGCRDTVEEGVNGYKVPVRDPAALAAALLRFVDAPERIAAMGAASRAMAEAQCDERMINGRMLAAMGLDAS